MSGTVLAVEPTLNDFGHDPWWLVLIKIVVVFAFLVVMTLVAIVYERKVVAYMQVRPGPNRTGPWGLLQSLADGMKLAFKEDVMPVTADKVVYFFAPVISAVAAFTAFAVMPFGPMVSIFGHRTPLQLADTPVGVLIVLACSSMGIYGVVLAGWSSGSTYPLLGGLRSSAQMISYEVAMGLSIVAVFMTANTMSTSGIVAAQAGGSAASLAGVRFTAPGWYAILLLPSFLIYFVSAVGETNRAPFDLPEAETELVGGFHTEYSSLKFALFFLAEYINMVTVSALCTTLFLGGWHAIWPLTLWGGANSGWVPVVWFTIKLFLVLFVFVWLRGTLPRLRYDQFMRFGWKVLIPANLVWILLLAGLKTLQGASIGSGRRLLIAVAAAVVIVLVVMFWPGGRAAEQAKADEETVRGVGEPYAATGSLPAGGRVGGAQGFPLPPADLVVPPSPRTRRLDGERVTVGARGGAGDGTGGAAGEPGGPTTGEREV